MDVAVLLIAAASLLGVYARASSEEFEFVPDTTQWVALRYGDSTYPLSIGKMSIGKLDVAGNFLPDKRYMDLHGDLLSGVPLHRLLNSPAGPAYEFRSGRLIFGEMAKLGDFVPQLGSKVIPFKEHQPGRFERKGSKERN